MNARPCGLRKRSMSLIAWRRRIGERVTVQATVTDG
jgi:hypothetical protein